MLKKAFKEKGETGECKIRKINYRKVKNYKDRTI